MKLMKTMIHRTLLSGVVIVALALAGCSAPANRDPGGSTATNGSAGESPSPISPSWKDPAIALSNLWDDVVDDGAQPLGQYVVDGDWSGNFQALDMTDRIGFKLTCASAGLEWDVRIDEDRWAYATCADGGGVYGGNFAVKESDQGKVVITLTIKGGGAMNGSDAIFLVTYRSKA
jgi:hypothetical protein